MTIVSSTTWRRRRCRRRCRRRRWRRRWWRHGGRRRATLVLVVATPTLLLIAPARHPAQEALVAIELVVARVTRWVHCRPDLATPVRRLTTIGFLLCGPSGLPIRPLDRAIEIDGLVLVLPEGARRTPENVHQGPIVQAEHQRDLLAEPICKGHRRCVLVIVGEMLLGTACMMSDVVPDPINRVVDLVPEAIHVVGQVRLQMRTVSMRGCELDTTSAQQHRNQADQNQKGNAARATDGDRDPAARQAATVVAGAHVSVVVAGAHLVSIANDGSTNGRTWWKHRRSLPRDRNGEARTSRHGADRSRRTARTAGPCVPASSPCHVSRTASPGHREGLPASQHRALPRTTSGQCGFSRAKRAQGQASKRCSPL